MKHLVKTFLTIFVFLLLVLPANAIKPADTPFKNHKQRGKTYQLNLYQKYYNEETGEWSVKKDGASARFIYNSNWGSYNLNASGLRAHTEYALINITDDSIHWLFADYSDWAGRIKINSGWSIKSGRVWLVLADDLDGQPFSSGSTEFRTDEGHWNPEEYLFPYSEVPPPAGP